jgi:hypothetical protein
MTINDISQLPFNIEGLDLSNNTISLSKVGERGAAVTPSKHLSKYYVNAGRGNGLWATTHIEDVYAVAETYAVIPSWTMKLGETVSCTIVWGPGEDYFQAEFKIIE